MTKPMNFDGLDYRPNCGLVDIRGKTGEWSVRVPVDQGRAMEADGIAVMWPYASVPDLALRLGLGVPWMYLSRLATWPARCFGGK